MMKNIKGSLILLIAALIWGTAFVAQTSGSEVVPPFTFNASRSFIGALFLFFCSKLLFIGKNKSVRSDGVNSMADDSSSGWPIKGGILCGLVLFFAMGFQQFGIGLYPEGVAVSGRSGFLTATYVVMVALYSQIVAKKISPLIIVSVTGVITGMYLLCMSAGFSEIYVGDVLEFMCAICFTLHILVIDKFSVCDSVKLSCIQFLTCGIMSFAVAVISETIVPEDILNAIGPIMFAGVMSSGVAYTLQMVGQKYAKPAVASIVMSLESVFSVLAGWIILNERLTSRELTGCIIVFAAVIISQISCGFDETEK